MNWGEHLRVLVGILAIVNPLGAVPIFLSVTAGDTKPEQAATARTAALTVAITLFCAAWFGERLLGVFGIGIPAFRVGGGILILLMGISMLHARSTGATHSPDEAAEAQEREAVGVVPLGIPLMAGPGAMALVIVDAHRTITWTDRGLLSASIVLVAIAVWIALHLAETIGKKLGKTGINISTRLMGLLLTAIAVEFIAAGAVQLFPGLK